MYSTNENIQYTIQEIYNKKEKFTYGDLMNTLVEIETIRDCIQEKDYRLMEIEYDAVYSYYQAQKIAEYYNIPNSSYMNKTRLLQSIVMFEKDYENIEIVYERKKKWNEKIC